jgi:hypothetical protein
MRFAVLLVTLLMGCASRQVPKTFPVAAAVNPDAPPAPVADAAAVVRGELPLPGEPSTSWPALEASHAP